MKKLLVILSIFANIIARSDLSNFFESARFHTPTGYEQAITAIEKHDIKAFRTCEINPNDFFAIPVSHETIREIVGEEMVKALKYAPKETRNLRIRISYLGLAVLSAQQAWADKDRDGFLKTLEIIKELLKRNCSPNVSISISAWDDTINSEALIAYKPLLFVAVNNPTILYILLQAGGRAGGQNYFGKTLLDAATHPQSKSHVFNYLHVQKTFPAIRFSSEGNDTKIEVNIVRRTGKYFW